MEEEQEVAVEEVSTIEKLVKLWNEFAGDLINLHESWDRFQELYQESSRAELEASVSLNKYASMFGKTRFDLMLPELVGHCRAFAGGYDKLMITDLEKEKEDV